MKNQHFGDLNDYLKYGLLRFLANAGQYGLGVCWMLTEDEASRDTAMRHYLQQPELWRCYDPVLFEQFQQWERTQQPREVTTWIQNPHLLPGARFYGAMLTDTLRDRLAYFKRMQVWLNACDLIFYDSDLGIETPSCPKGRQHSAKYIYWDELNATFAAGHSVLVHQRFWREERTAFMQRMVAEYRAHLRNCQVYALRTQHVAYFLCVQANHAEYLAHRVQALNTYWGDKIQWVCASNPHPEASLGGAVSQPGIFIANAACNKRLAQRAQQHGAEKLPA